MPNYNGSFIVYFNENAEQVLLSTGYDKMSVEDKNSLLAIIADKENMAFTDITPDYILQYHKDLKIAWLCDQRDAAIHAGFTATDNHQYSTKPDDQINMLGQMLKIMADSTITSVQWSQADSNTLATYTVDDWKNYVFSQTFTFKDEQMVKCNGYITTIMEATSHDQIVSVTWP